MKIQSCIQVGDGRSFRVKHHVIQEKTGLSSDTE